MKDHPLHFSGNGILRLYNLFPYQYENIEAMINDMPRIAALGFNSIWINPIQKTGLKTAVAGDNRQTGILHSHQVVGSLYAAEQHDYIDERFLFGSKTPVSEGDLVIVSQKMMRRFTDKIKEAGLVPLFDLVLNHVSSDSLLCQLHPEWFGPVNDIYLDVRPFNYNDPRICAEIIEQLWKPYLERYILQYGFAGVRIDLARNIHPEVRHVLYEYVKKLTNEQYGRDPIILDEVLYDDKSHAEVASELKTADAVYSTHITSSAYWVHPQDNGETELWYKDEIQCKSSILAESKSGKLRENVKGGTVNFCGNHDEFSLAGMVLEEMARKRLKQDPKFLHAHNCLATDFRLPKDTIKILQQQFLFSYMQDIQQEMQVNADLHAEFQRRCCERIAISAFTSKAGWYLLCGDEFGDVTRKSVFRHAGSQQDFYPHRQHKAFLEHAKFAQSCLEKMAEKMLGETYPINQLLAALEESDRKRLLQTYVEECRIQINAGKQSACEDFAELMKAVGPIQFADNDYIDEKRNAENHWRGKEDFSSYIADVNQLLKALPAAKANEKFNCEIIRIPEQPNLWAFIRRQEPYAGQVPIHHSQISVVLVSPGAVVECNTGLLQSIARLYQKRMPEVRGVYEEMLKAQKFVGQNILLSPELKEDRTFQKLAAEWRAESRGEAFFSSATREAEVVKPVLPQVAAPAFQ